MITKYEKSIQLAQIVKVLKIAYFRKRLENVNFMLIFNSTFVSNRRN